MLRASRTWIIILFIDVLRCGAGELDAVLLDDDQSSRADTIELEPDVSEVSVWSCDAPLPPAAVIIPGLGDFAMKTPGLLKTPSHTSDLWDQWIHSTTEFSIYVEEDNVGLVHFGTNDNLEQQRSHTPYTFDSATYEEKQLDNIFIEPTRKPVENIWEPLKRRISTDFSEDDMSIIMNFKNSPSLFHRRIDINDDLNDDVQKIVLQLKPLSTKMEIELSPVESVIQDDNEIVEKKETPPTIETEPPSDVQNFRNFSPTPLEKESNAESIQALKRKSSTDNQSAKPEATPEEPKSKSVKPAGKDAEPARAPQLTIFDFLPKETAPVHIVLQQKKKAKLAATPSKTDKQVKTNLEPKPTELPSSVSQLFQPMKLPNVKIPLHAHVRRAHYDKKMGDRKAVAKEGRTRPEQHGKEKEQKTHSEYHGKEKEHKTHSEYHGKEKEHKMHSEHHGKEKEHKKMHSEHHGKDKEPKTHSEHHGRDKEPKTQPLAREPRPRRSSRKSSDAPQKIPAPITVPAPQPSTSYFETESVDNFASIMLPLSENPEDILTNEIGEVYLLQDDFFEGVLEEQAQSLEFPTKSMLMEMKHVKLTDGMVIPHYMLPEVRVEKMLLIPGMRRYSTAVLELLARKTRKLRQIKNRAKEELTKNTQHTTKSECVKTCPTHVPGVSGSKSVKTENESHIPSVSNSKHVKTEKETHRTHAPSVTGSKNANTEKETRPTPVPSASGSKSVKTEKETVPSAAKVEQKPAEAPVPSVPTFESASKQFVCQQMDEFDKKFFV